MFFIRKVLILAMCYELTPSHCRSECSTGADLDEPQFKLLLAHLEAFELRLEEKLTARIEEKLHCTIKEELQKEANDGVEGKLAELVASVGELEAQTESVCVQKKADVQHLIEDILLPRLDTLESNARIGNEQTTRELSRVIRDQANQLDYTMNHPSVFRDGLWITIQHRFDGSTDFHRNWTDYREGFGSTRAEHWYGLEKLYDVLRTGEHELLVLLEDFDGAIVHAHYSNFRIGSEAERYTLKSIGEYFGTAGDALQFHVGAPFSTYDAPSNIAGSVVNCAAVHHGGWWFRKFPWCTKSHLNGKYSKDPAVACGMGLNWSFFRGCKYSFKSTKMMIRRTHS